METRDIEQKRDAERERVETNGVPRWQDCLLVVVVCSVLPVCVYAFHLFDLPELPLVAGSISLAHSLSWLMEWVLAPLSMAAGGVWTLLLIASLSSRLTEKEEQ